MYLLFTTKCHLIPAFHAPKQLVSTDLPPRWGSWYEKRLSSDARHVIGSMMWHQLLEPLGLNGSKFDGHDEVGQTVQPDEQSIQDLYHGKQGRTHWTRTNTIISRTLGEGCLPSGHTKHPPESINGDLQEIFETTINSGQDRMADIVKVTYWIAFFKNKMLCFLFKCHWNVPKVQSTNHNWFK